MTHRYVDLQSAACGVLCESVRIATEISQQFTVVGGWSPFLLNNGPIVHPGTKDVDLLFKHGTTPGALKDVVQAFLDHGYLTSAKHPFQLLRVIDVAGTDFVFNVDFLHSAQIALPDHLFVDHLVIDDGPLLYRYQSIVVPMSALLFEPAGMSRVNVDAMTPDGNRSVVSVPLMTELGTLLTKAESMKNPKRSRDAFDALLSVVQARDVDVLVDNIIQNCVQDRIENLGLIVTDARLRRNIEKYWPAAKSEEEWQKVEQRVTRFLDDVGVETSESESV